MLLNSTNFDSMKAGVESLLSIKGCFVIAVAFLVCAAAQSETNIPLWILCGISAAIGTLMIILNATASVNVHSFFSYGKYSKICGEISDKVRNEAFRDAELKALYEKKLGNKVDKKTDTEDVKITDVPKKSHKKAGVIVSVICLCVAGGAIGGYFYFGRLCLSSRKCIKGARKRSLNTEPCKCQ